MGKEGRLPIEIEPLMLETAEDLASVIQKLIVIDGAWSSRSIQSLEVIKALVEAVLQRKK